MRVRAVAKLFNYEMQSAKKNKGYTLRKLKEISGVSISEICMFQRFQYTMYNAEDKAIRLAIALEIPIDQIYPEEIRDKKIQTKFESIRDVDINKLTTDTDPAVQLLGNEEYSKLEKSMSVLTFREKHILSMRNGFDGQYPFTYSEIGQCVKLTRERVRQIEYRAIFKLKKRLVDTQKE